ncbi:hypothetical protein EII31_06525 [Leucobacter sp. OH2974_COT-288]|nr:hypothetical protein EII31_06525 [Leucobacter sp. OH2974_COT-288]
MIPEDNFYNMSLAISVTTTMFALLGITLDRKLGRATFWLLMINSSVSAVASAMWISSAFAVLWIDDVYQAKLGLGVLIVPASFFYGMLPAFTWLKFVSAQKSCADGKKREIQKQS